jgi:hypothetical protein
MNLWTAIVIIVALGTIGGIYKAHRHGNPGISDDAFKNVAQRLNRLEERMANLETIVLDKEKARKYDKL